MLAKNFIQDRYDMNTSENMKQAMSAALDQTQMKIRDRKKNAIY